MPLFDYKCTSCGETLEVLQKFNEGAPKECPKCKAKDTLERQVSQSSFHLKGDGWFKDLYSSSKKKS